MKMKMKLHDRFGVFALCLLTLLFLGGIAVAAFYKAISVNAAGWITIAVLLLGFDLVRQYRMGRLHER